MSEYIYECPSCGGEFATKLKRQITCSVSCRQKYNAPKSDWSAVPKEKECPICRKNFGKNPKHSVKQWSKTVFCSLRCAGTGKKGIARSEETKEKLSQAHKGTKKPWAGKYERTEECLKAQKDGVRRFLESEKAEKWKEKLRKAHTGRVVSQESRQRMVEAQRGRPSYRGGKATERYRKSFYQRQREFRKSSSGRVSLDEWEEKKREFLYTCPMCLKSEPDIQLTQDHIIPLSSGGANLICNIQPLCHSCNSSKNTKAVSFLPSMIALHFNDSGIEPPPWPHREEE